MKKGLFMLPLLGGLIVAGCSSDDTIAGVDTLPESYVNSYLSVSVIGANAAGGTRVADEEYEEGQGTYQDGTENENNVKTVRFFFFDENDEAAMVQKKSNGEGYLSYYDMETSKDGGGNHGSTVEKIIETTLRLNIPDGYKNPSKVLAVINPTKDITDMNNPSLAALKGEIATESENVITNFKKGLTVDNFVMSNSVYANTDEKKTVIDAEMLEDKNFQTTETAAEQNPVRIYVERVLARLDFSIGMEKPEEVTGDNIYKLKVPEGSNNAQYDIVGDDGESVSSDIYVKLLGWNITGTPVKSRLIKKVNGEWETSALFGENEVTVGPWTAPNYHRSFWALNPDLGDRPSNATSNPNYEFVSFTETSLLENLPSGGESETTYLQENANAYSVNMDAATPDYATKVIIAAQLVNKEGEPLALAKWLNGYYTVEGVKVAMANMLDLYKKDGDAYKKIEPDDLVLGKATVEGAKSYYAQATVKEGTTWYIENGEEWEEKDKTAADSYIYTKLGYALVWDDNEKTKGYTYYYFDIHHLGSENSFAYNGIVRNHIYKTTLSSIAGLGTPVYDPDDKIYPETPEKESIISAKVNILSWRVVSSSYDLTW